MKSLLLVLRMYFWLEGTAFVLTGISFFTGLQRLAGRGRWFVFYLLLAIALGVLASASAALWRVKPEVARQLAILVSIGNLLIVPYLTVIGVLCLAVLLPTPAMEIMCPGRAAQPMVKRYTSRVFTAAGICGTLIVTQQCAQGGLLFWPVWAIPLMIGFIHFAEMCVREAGHVAGALAAGLSIACFHLGPVRFRRNTAGWSIQWRPDLGYSAATRPAPADDSRLSSNLFLFFSGGACAEFLSGVLALTLFMMCQEGALAYLVFPAGIWCSFAFSGVLSNMAPDRGADGAALLKLLRGGESAAAVRARFSAPHLPAQQPESIY